MHIRGALATDLLGLGKPALGRAEPTLDAAGILDGVRGLYRSTDEGAHWLRINDDRHQRGLRFRILVSDPKRFGRVYLGTDGRGILYGGPVLC